MDTTNPIMGKPNLPTPAPVAPPAGSPVTAPSPTAGAPWDREGAPTLVGDGRSGRGEAESSLTGTGCATGRLPNDGVETARRSSMREREGGRQPNRCRPCRPSDLWCRAPVAAGLRRRVAGPYANGREEATQVSPEGKRRGGMFCRVSDAIR
jgi:hypothetical protein